MRSPFLMSRDDTGLLVIDLQEKLMGKILQGPAVIHNTLLLVQGAAILGLPVYATEQYPKGLGPTVPELSGKLPIKQEKLSFSGVMPEVVDFFKSKGVLKVLLAGVEAHVCVQQTALDLIAQGFQVYLAADAVGSRHAEDKEHALRRMEGAGVVLTTAEAAVFEWTERAGVPEFKAISQLIVESDAKK